MSCDSKLQKFSREIIDVIVIGGGNAALCAAISARRAGAKVLIMESSPQYFRGVIAVTQEICDICIIVQTIT